MRRESVKLSIKMRREVKLSIKMRGTRDAAIVCVVVGGALIMDRWIANVLIFIYAIEKLSFH